MFKHTNQYININYNYKGAELFLINILPCTSDGMIVTQLIKEITFVYKIWLMNDQSEIPRTETR